MIADREGMPDSVRLRMFLLVADLGSASGAARVLGLTQSAVSKSLSRWQEEEGIRLLEQRNGRMVPTAAGAELLPIARRVVGEVGLASLCLRSFRDGDSVSILTSESFGVYFLPEVLRRMRERWPSTRVRACLAHNAEVEESVAACLHDLGVVSSPGRDPLLSYHHLVDDEIVLVAPADHELAGLVVHPTALAGRPFVRHEPGSVPRNLVDDLFRRHGVDPDGPFEVSNVETMKTLVREGAGLAFLSRRSAEGELRRGLLAEVGVEGERLGRAFHLVLRRGRVETPAMRRLYHLARGLDGRTRHDLPSDAFDELSGAGCATT